MKIETIHNPRLDSTDVCIRFTLDEITDNLSFAPKGKPNNSAEYRAVIAAAEQLLSAMRALYTKQRQEEQYGWDSRYLANTERADNSVKQLPQDNAGCMCDEG